MLKNAETTKIFLNTWGAYNNGSIGYGWMDATEARDFIEADPERDGGEWFIADIDNYLEIEFKNLEYANVLEVLNTIETLEDMDEWERKEVVALMEYIGTEDVNEAIDAKDHYTFYQDVDAYHDACDEIIEAELNAASEFISRYFDYKSYHRDCDFDMTEMSNGIVITE